jgi:hypothetical protein
MDKMAQTRGLLNQLREKINMPKSYLDGFFKPELDRVMTSLKELDDRIRATLTGKKIGNADPMAGDVAAKDLIKSARSNFNRREYIAGIVDLGHFHKMMFDIVSDVSKFFVDVNKIHNKFLFEGLPESYQDRLQKMREHMERKAQLGLAQQIIKEAGIMDFFHNIGSKRGRSLMAWEKHYPKETKELRDGGSRLVEDAQRLLDNTISYLKQMATFRATRHPDQYMEIAKKIKGEFDRFDNGDKGFKAYYNGVIMPFLKIKDSIEATEKANAEKAKATIPDSDPELTPKIELGVRPAPISETKAIPLVQEKPFPLVNTYAPVKDEELEDVGPDTQRNPQPQMITADKPPRMPDDTKRSHQRFFDSLETLGKESPAIVAKYIAKYASSIQSGDPETAIKLFAIAQSVKV